MLANTWAANTSTQTINILYHHVINISLFYFVHSPHVKTEYLQLNQSPKINKMHYNKYKYSTYRTGKMLLLKANAAFSSEVPFMSLFVERFSIRFKSNIYKYHLGI